ncbi:Retrotransposon gag domain,SAP domain,Zinc finger, CCHC-type [Cinara cedri]|uniref:Retrotransposon gag domain,SAP domain,Zinc finger, CCHC-type n=1 Tax=Cinara cedri TaxID=506608 RepID=A0A5E4MMQ3_9HEMI|nr:Retrotransposon gag domain,SAP domain,Zinc finger, CCHC-type [Cinara cedri]
MDPINSIFTPIAETVSNLDQKQIETELIKRGLITSGTLSELRTRLLQYLMGESIPTDFTKYKTPTSNQANDNEKTTKITSKKPYFKPGTFSGLNWENFDSFINKYNMSASINDWSDEDKIRYFPGFLEGTALKTYENIPDNSNIKTKWSNLEKHFRIQIESTAQIDILRSQLEKRKQLDDEQPMVYITVIESLCRRIDPLMIQQEIIRNIMKDLKSDIIRYVGFMDNNTVENLKQNIQKFEKIEFMASGSLYNQSPLKNKESTMTENINKITSQFNDKFNTLSEQLKTQNTQYFRDNNYTPRYNSSKGQKTFGKNNNFESQIPRTQCNNCKIYNHTSENCRFPINPPTCQLCNRISHIACECRQYFNQSKNE